MVEFRALLDIITPALRSLSFSGNFVHSFDKCAADMVLHRGSVFSQLSDLWLDACASISGSEPLIHWSELAVSLPSLRVISLSNVRLELRPNVFPTYNLKTVYVEKTTFVGSDDSRCFLGVQTSISTLQMNHVSGLNLSLQASSFSPPACGSCSASALEANDKLLRQTLEKFKARTPGSWF